MSELIREDVEKIRDSLIEQQDGIGGRTFLVAGGAGFLGSWFCDVVDAFGGKIICVDNFSSGSKKNIGHLIGKSNFRLIDEDVCSLATTESIDYIVHMACLASPPLYQKFPLETLDTSVLGTRNLLEIARPSSVKGFLLASTSEIYGNATVFPTPEDYWGYVNPIGPRSIYDEGKRVAETYCRTYFQKYGLPIRVARIFNTYGPRLDVGSTTQYGRALVKFIVQALENKALTIYGDGTQTRSFCYVTDMIGVLFKLLLTPGLDGQVLNVGNDEETSILDLAKRIVELCGSNSGFVFEPLPDDDPKRRKPDIGKAKKLLGWKPRFTLHEGLTRTINWVSVH